MLLFAAIAQAFMFLSTSIDRLICVTFPLKYMALTRTYSCLLILCIYFVSIVIYGFIWLSLLGETKETVSSTCFLSDVLQIEHFRLFCGIRLSASICSVLLCVLVVFIFKKRASAIRPLTFSRMNLQSEILQRKLTLTVIICSILTFTFYVAPCGLSMYFKSYFASGAFINSFLWPYTSINAILAACCFTYRHMDIRHGIRYLLSR